MSGTSFICMSPALARALSLWAIDEIRCTLCCLCVSTMAFLTQANCLKP